MYSPFPKYAAACHRHEWRTAARLLQTEAGSATAGFRFDIPGGFLQYVSFISKIAIFVKHLHKVRLRNARRPDLFKAWDGHSRKEGRSRGELN
jgi:hypothetical protein